MTCLSPYIAPPGRRRRGGDLETIDMDALGPISPGQARAVFRKFRDLESAPPSAESVQDAKIRYRCDQWNVNGDMTEIDAIIADRRLQERYGVQLSASIDYLLDRFVRASFDRRS